jgi:hypothetical protein
MLHAAVLHRATTALQQLLTPHPCPTTLPLPAELPKLCPAKAGKADKDEERTTLKCLATKAGEVNRQCRSEIISLVRLHLTQYRMGMPLTEVCDGDVLTR